MLSHLILLLPPFLSAPSPAHSQTPSFEYTDIPNLFQGVICGSNLAEAKVSKGGEVIGNSPASRSVRCFPQVCSYRRPSSPQLQRFQEHRA